MDRCTLAVRVTHRTVHRSALAICANLSCRFVQSTRLVANLSVSVIHQPTPTRERVNLLLSSALIHPDTRPPVPTSAASPCVSPPSHSCPSHSALLPVSLRPWCRQSMLCMRQPRPCCRRGMAAWVRRRRLSSPIQQRVSTIRCPASLLATLTPTSVPTSALMITSASHRIHSTDLAWSHRARPP